MTIRMQESMNATINYQVKLISKNEINARYKVWYRWFHLCIVVINESMPVPSSDVILSQHHKEIDKSIKSFKN